MQSFATATSIKQMIESDRSHYVMAVVAVVVAAAVAVVEVAEMSGSIVTNCPLDGRNMGQVVGDAGFPEPSALWPCHPCA